MDVSDLTEFEYAWPCKRRGCDLEAVALYSKSHTIDAGCWGEPLTLCQAHLASSLRDYEEWLSTGGTCIMCLQPVRGGISVNTRIVRI